MTLYKYRKAIQYRMSKHTAKDYNQRSRRKYKRTFSIMDMKFISNKSYMTHHTDNSYYYFDGKYKGRRYLFIRGQGIIEMRTDTYIKKFDDDPILGWWNR